MKKKPISIVFSSMASMHVSYVYHILESNNRGMNMKHSQVFPLLIIFLLTSLILNSGQFEYMH